MKFRSSPLYFLPVLLLMLSACTQETAKKATVSPKPGMTEFNDQQGNPDHSPQAPKQEPTSANDDNSATPTSHQLFVQMKVLNISDAEMARWQGAGVETIVINGMISTPGASEIAGDFENGAPMCVIDFDSASSLANDFTLSMQETDDTQELAQTNFSLQDEAGDHFSIRCLHKIPLTLEALQQTFRGMLEFPTPE